jgi:hypothetical protein
VRYLFLLIGGWMLWGCQTGTLDDPNEIKSAGVMAPEVIRRQLKGTSDMLMARVAKGEITDAQFKELIAKRANELLADLPLDKIAPEKAWEYGDVLRTAQRWPQAKRALEIAVDHARKGGSEDRLINDTLRLAHAQAMLGEIPEAIATADKTMTASAGGSSPILPAVLLEIVPAARGKGHDPALAGLLEKAINKHVATVVDPQTEPGEAFLMARPHHVRNAWRTVVDLYAKSDKDEEARAAIQRSEEMLRGMRRL